ncbi:hypothetical protein [uncultured Methylobacterium sp.]|uniref:hypothetical protein n=1 Tax=uncultured Methylobacterium sp. TaxID=157278 RepID=UPI0035CC11DD
MSFLLRAALVIGTLSYLAAMRDRPGVPGASSVATATETALAASIQGQPAAPGKDAALPAAIGGLQAAWNAMPAQARQRIAHEAVAELGRRTGPATSHDTLAEADRRAAWRGTEPR